MAHSSASPRFDRILIVDWSGANSPKTGKDSIWIADSHAASVNPPTRAEAIAHIQKAIEDSLIRSERVLIGWDFAFGYPAGFANALGLSGWSGLWAWLYNRIEDGADNRSNRFEVAAEMNLALRANGRAVSGPFWGHVGKTCPPGLSPKRYPDRAVRDWPFAFDYVRYVERAAPGAKSVFQLAYNGSVGSQTLLGIARLEGLRRTFAGQIAVWPFETDFAARLSAPITQLVTPPVTLAEIYPSAHRVPDGPDPKDQRQVEAVLANFLAWTETDRMHDALSARTLSRDDRAWVKRDEGWIIGV